MREVLTEEIVEGIIGEASNTKLLAVRIPDALHEYLEAVAVQRDMTVPEVVRSMIIFHVLPLLVKLLMKKKLLHLKEEADIKILDYEITLKWIIHSCEQVDKIHERALQLEKQLGELKEQYKKAFDSISEVLEV